MQLVTIDYQERRGTDREWTLTGLSLGHINLLVGRNSTGKSRCLNIVHGIARFLQGQQPLPDSGDFKCKFVSENHKLEYNVQFNRSKVESESFLKSGEQPDLIRQGGGEGKIYFEKEKKFFDFQLPENLLAAVARQDKIQHSFLLPLQTWSASTYYYPFGTDMGRNTLGFVAKDGPTAVDFHDAQQVIGVFRSGEKQFGEKYKAAIMADMEMIGFDIEDVGTVKPTMITVPPQLAGEAITLYVKERSLNGITEQLEMSQGMFRALSILIHVIYGFYSNSASLLLIDDIGEGLDFERSTALIGVLMDRTKNSNVQLVMATNDRFIMNSVPLEYWSVLTRDGSLVTVSNYTNSKQKFEDFKFTGLNNFDFFTSDFLNTEKNTP